MNPIFLIAAAAAATPASSGDPEAEIVVTASLVPVPEEEAAPAVTRFDEDRIEVLDPVLAVDLLRLAPGVSVSVSGGQGSFAQVRIRGSEASHTLVFVDGIAFNDVAANNAARFETFAADGLGRLELIRGPQSALWGSEALGGVVAMDSPDPLGVRRVSGSAEYGSRDSARASAALATGGARSGLSAVASWARSDGIDIIGGGAGDRDGFENFTAGLKGVARPSADIEIGAASRYVRHFSEYDDVNAFFQRADTPHASTAEIKAVRAWAAIGTGEDARWGVKFHGQYLDSENRNRLAGVPTNDSGGRRIRFGAQAFHRFDALGGAHQLIAAAEREDEDFRTRDRRFGGASDRDLERGRNALVGEWRAEWGDLLVTDLAVRHDDFSRFADETTLRANVVLNVSRRMALVAGYGEGIAQPTFVDLFGFGPGSGFVGNPALTPERSRGFEGGLRLRGRTLSVEAIAFSNALRDEIVEDFSPFPNYTVVNVPGRSRRRGVELSAEWVPAPDLRLAANYSFIDTREPGGAGNTRLREIRRPRHTANLYGDWRRGPLTLGASLAYVGARIDSDFDLFPAPRVRLGDYLLASARIAYRIGDAIELFGRVENAGDAVYQDVVGFNTAGRSVYAGLRLRLGD